MTALPGVGLYRPSLELNGTLRELALVGIGYGGSCTDGRSPWLGLLGRMALRVVLLLREIMIERRIFEGFIIPLIGNGRSSWRRFPCRFSVYVVDPFAFDIFPRLTPFVT